MEYLNFEDGNPGAVRFGNFINYYQFHPPETRISLLPQDIWYSSSIMNKRPCAVLDIGCNTGDLTISIYEFLTKTIGMTNCNILGIDIDPILIKRACEQNTIEKVSFKCLDIMSKDTASSQPLSDYLSTYNSTKFDIVFCFSISMWIHLNHGDCGLRKWLKKVSELSHLLIIEPQPWKCYKTAVKRLKLSNGQFPKFKELKIRQNVEEEIERYIVEECGLKKIKESERTQWGRKLIFFKCEK